MLVGNPMEHRVAASQKAIQNDPNDAGLQANLALALLIDGNIEGAEKAAVCALERAPEDEITTGLLALIREVRDGKRQCPSRWPP